MVHSQSVDLTGQFEFESSWQLVLKEITLGYWNFELKSFETKVTRIILCAYVVLMAVGSKTVSNIVPVTEKMDKIGWKGRSPVCEAFHYG